MKLELIGSWWCFGYYVTTLGLQKVALAEAEDYHALSRLCVRGAVERWRQLSRALRSTLFNPRYMKNFVFEDLCRNRSMFDLSSVCLGWYCIT